MQSLKEIVYGRRTCWLILERLIKPNKNSDRSIVQRRRNIKALYHRNNRVYIRYLETVYGCRRSRYCVEPRYLLYLYKKGVYDSIKPHRDLVTTFRTVLYTMCKLYRKTPAGYKGNAKHIALLTVVPFNILPKQSIYGTVSFIILKEQWGCFNNVRPIMFSYIANPGNSVHES